MSLVKKAFLAGSIAVSSLLPYSADASDIVCKKQVQVFVPEVVTIEQVRHGTKEVPVTCYRNEKKCIEEQISEPTCDPCNPVMTRIVRHEVEVAVPYVTMQKVPFDIKEKKQVVQYHPEIRTIETKVHIDDCTTSLGYSSKKIESNNCWYPGKNLVEKVIDPLFKGDKKQDFSQQYSRPDCGCNK